MKFYIKLQFSKSGSIYSDKILDFLEYFSSPLTRTT